MTNLPIEIVILIGIAIYVLSAILNRILIIWCNKDTETVVTEDDYLMFTLVPVWNTIVLAAFILAGTIYFILVVPAKKILNVKSVEELFDWWMKPVRKKPNRKKPKMYYHDEII